MLHFRTEGDECESVSDKGVWLQLARQHVQRKYGGGRCHEWQQTYLLVLGARARTSNSERVRVLEEHVKAALLRTRPGKATGRSGIAAEHVLAGGASTCTTLTRLFQARLDDPTVECIATWDEVVLCLLPKKHKAILQDMRPIALGEVVRNIFVRAVLASILESGRLRFATWQYAYRRGYQCLHVLHRVQTVMVKAAEWGVPVLVARLDVASAFDSIAYDRLAGAMVKAGMSETEVFVILREVLATRAFVRIGRQTSEEPDNLERGGRQGGPETPFLWCLYLQAALEDVVQSWSDPAAPAGVDLEGWLAARGQGIEVGMEARPERTSLLAWADDLFLFAHCQRDMQRMLTDTVAALAHLDLAIRPDKVRLLHGKWVEQTSVVVGDEVVVSGPELECLGCTVQLDGNSGRQQERAIQKGLAAFQKHRAMLVSRCTPLKARFRAWARTVPSAIRWGMAAFPHTKEQLLQLDRLQTKQLLQIAGSRPRPDEETAAWQRRRHVWLRMRMRNWRVPKLSELILRDMHAWAGHLVRESGPLARLTGWRDSSWWQAHVLVPHANRVINVRRPHVGRPTRWEDVFVHRLGVAWREKALDREEWRVSAPKVLG